MRGAGRHRVWIAGACVAALTGLFAAPAPAAAADRYSFAGGCYAVESLQADRFVVRNGDGYAATASRPGAESFRMKATALGRYLFYGRDRHLIATGLGSSVVADDEPGDVVHDRFAEAVYGDRPLGRLVSGTTDSVSAMTRRQVVDFYRRHYTAGSIVVAVAGNLEHRAVLRQVRAAFAPLLGTGHHVAPRRGGGPARLGRDRLSHLADELLVRLVPVEGGAALVRERWPVGDRQQSLGADVATVGDRTQELAVFRE